MKSGHIHCIFYRHSLTLLNVLDLVTARRLYIYNLLGYSNIQFYHQLIHTIFQSIIRSVKINHSADQSVNTSTELKSDSGHKFISHLYPSEQAPRSISKYTGVSGVQAPTPHVKGQIENINTEPSVHFMAIDICIRNVFAIAYPDYILNLIE